MDDNKVDCSENEIEIFRDALKRAEEQTASGYVRLRLESDGESPNDDAINVEMDVEDALKTTGAFGTFQKRMFWALCLWQFATSFLTLLITFIGSQPTIKCDNGTSDSSQCEVQDGNCTEEYHFHSFVQDVCMCE